MGGRTRAVGRTLILILVGAVLLLVAGLWLLSSPTSPAWAPTTLPRAGLKALTAGERDWHTPLNESLTILDTYGCIPGVAGACALGAGHQIDAELGSFHAPFRAAGCLASECDSSDEYHALCMDGTQPPATRLRVCTESGWVQVAGTGVGLDGHVVQWNAMSLTQRDTLNIIDGGAAVTCVDNPSNTTTDCTFTTGSGDVTAVFSCTGGDCGGLVAVAGDTLDMGGGDSSRPCVRGTASPPATCSVGACYQETDQPVACDQLWLCTAANVWSRVIACAPAPTTTSTSSTSTTSTSVTTTSVLGAVSAVQVEPFGPVGGGTTLPILSDRCRAWQTPMPYVDNDGILSLALDIVVPGDGNDVARVGVYTADGATQEFAAVVPVTAPGPRVVANAATPQPYLPGDHWYVFCCDDVSGATCKVRLREAGASATYGKQIEWASTGAVLASSIGGFVPANPWVLSRHPAYVATVLEVTPATTSTVNTTSTTTSSAGPTTSSSSSTTSTSTSSTTSTTVAGSGAAPQNWSGSVLARWNLDEASGTRVSDGSCTTDCALTDTNTVTQSTVNLCPNGAGTADTTVCEPSAAATFTAANNEYLSCADATCDELDPAAGGDRSWGCFVNPVAGGVNGQAILDNHDGTVGFALWRDDGSAQAQIYCQAGSDFANGVSGNSPDGEAVHAVCAADAPGNGLTLYVNGTASGAAGVTGTMDGDTADAALSHATAATDFDGQLDECFVDDVVWTALQSARAARCGISGELCCCDQSTPTSYKAGCTTDSDCRQGSCSAVALCDTTSGRCEGRRIGTPVVLQGAIDCNVGAP